jgi:PAS domain S-box-containing protein
LGPRILASCVLSGTENHGSTKLPRNFRDGTLGNYGRIALVGTDHVVRASFGADSPDGLAGAGTLLPSPDDTVVSSGASTVVESTVDHFTRLYTERQVGGYPLVVAVGLDVSELLASAEARARHIEIGGIVVTLLLCWLIGALLLEARRRARNEVQLAAERCALAADVTLRRQTEQQLRESEQRFRDLTDIGPDWVWETDERHRIIFLAHNQLGDTRPSVMQPEEGLGQTPWELAGADPEQDEAWYQHKADFDARRAFRGFRYAVTAADGSVRHCCANGKPVFDSARRFRGFRGVIIDETRMVEALQRAERSETLLQDAVDSISEGFVIYDQEDRLVMCNDNYRSLYPESAGRMVAGVKFEELLRHGLVAGEYPEAVGREEAWLAQCMRDHVEANGEVEQRRGDGKWVLVTDRRMRNGGIAGLRVDVTALKQAEAHLRESEARLDRAQAIAGIGSWELDVATGRYIWSREMYRIHGVSSEDFGPTIDNMTSYVHPDDHPAIRSWLARLIDGLEPDALEIKIVRPDGKVRLILVEGQAVTDTEGVARRLAGTMQDVTERRLVEQQLAHAHKMEAMGNLTGGMAHDFNNGLGIIIGNLDLLGRLVKSDETAAELCHEAHQGAQRCADLIRRLLTFARRQPLRPVQLDVNALVSDAGRLLSRTLGEHIELRLNLGAKLWPALSDTAQLEAALVNLATNARDAMPKGGQLDITTRNVELDALYCALCPDVTPGKYALIEVSDTGTGIAPDILSQIFEPFFTTKGPSHGTGLGLSMVFGFLKQSGGHVSVYSEVGRGSTFRVYLPRAEVDEGCSRGRNDDEPVVGGDETILLVEDNAPLRLAARRQLNSLGYRVLEAEDAEAALRALATGERIDLLFTDVVMPGAMDGVDLARRAIAMRAGLSVLLTSGFPGTRLSEQQTATPEFQLIGKPYSGDGLARALREALDESAQLRPEQEPHGPAGAAASRQAGQLTDEVNAW